MLWALLLDSMKTLPPSHVELLVKRRKIGKDSVGEIGLGCMGMSWAYGPGDEAESLKVLDRALELGANHWDTADMYGAGANEPARRKLPCTGARGASCSRGRSARPHFAMLESR